MSRYKPYPSYKDSGVEWLGEVPKDWLPKRLKYHARIKNGQDQKKVLSDDGQYPVYGSGGEFGRANEYLYDKPSVLLGRKGTIDKPLFIIEPFWTVDTMYYTDIAKTTFPKFLYYSCLTIKFDYYQYGSAVPSMTQENLHNIDFATPSYEEQTAIANFLDRETAKIDTLIAKQERMIELLNEKRSAIISHAVTKGLDPDVKMKDSGVEWLGEVPRHWIRSNIGFETIVKARLGWKGLKAEEYVEDGYVFLATPNIKNSEIDFKNVNYITQERYEESPEIMLEEGDVLVTKDGSTTGTTNVVRELPRPATVNSSIAVIRPKDNIDSLYLYYFFISTYIQETINLMRGGMGVPHLFQGDLRKFDMLVPPKVEQKQIADYLDAQTAKIDTLVAKARQAIELMKERRIALISAAVTGKIDVRGIK